ncbi:MAG TPA: hypothetical protein VF086_14300 [Propionibacteriaceae bacterium]
MDGLGAKSHEDSGRGGRPVVDLDSCVGRLGCAAVLYGRAGVRDLGRRLLLWRVRWWWYPIVLVGPLVFAVTASWIAVLLGESWSAVLPSALTLSIPVLA